MQMEVVVGGEEQAAGLLISLPLAVGRFGRSAWLDFTQQQRQHQQFPFYWYCLYAREMKTNTHTHTHSRNSNTSRRRRQGKDVCGGEGSRHRALHYFCENLLNMPNTQRCMQSGKPTRQPNDPPTHRPCPFSLCSSTLWESSNQANAAKPS